MVDALAVHHSNDAGNLENKEWERSAVSWRHEAVLMTRFQIRTVNRERSPEMNSKPLRRVREQKCQSAASIGLSLFASGSEDLAKSVHSLVSFGT